MLINQPWGVSVSGHGAATAEPDHALVNLAINRLASEPATSLAEAKAAASAVRRSLRSHGVADSDITSSRTNVHSIWDGHGASRRLVGHQCRIEFAVQINSLDVVEPCLVDLVDAGADELLGVTYDTTREPELLAQARRQAIEAATAKARVYAEAADITLGPVVHIDDVEQPHLGGRRNRAALSAGPGDGDPTLPGAVVVNAAVVVGFSIAA